MTDPLQCTFDDARRQHLRDGVAMSTAAKVAWFEEMVALAVKFGAVDRLREREQSTQTAVVLPQHGEKS
jgi:ribosomal protein L1